MDYPEYREPGFVVFAFEQSLSAWHTDVLGKMDVLAGDSTKPPHWGLWRGNVHLASRSTLSESDLLNLLRRAQTALRCKENQPDLNTRR